jgi:two-component system response regulator YesN
MSGYITIAIADTEEGACKSLLKTITGLAISAKVIGFTFTNMDLLLKFIKKDKPEIVMSNIELPGFDVSKIMNRIKLSKMKSELIIFGRKKSFNCVYNALKFGASMYLVKPFDHGELKYAISKAVSNIKSVSRKMRKNQEETESPRSFFIKYALRGFKYKGGSIPEANKSHLTSFKPGLFRMIFIKLDCIAQEQFKKINLDEIYNTIENTAKRYFFTSCHDFVFDRVTDGVLILINYNKEREPSVRDNIKMIYQEMENLKRKNKKAGLSVTICIGLAYNDIADSGNTLYESLMSSWLRFFIGTNQIIYYEDFKRNKDDIEYENRLESLFGCQMKKALDVLDSEKFLACINELFKIPHKYLKNPETKMLLQDLIDYLFEKNEAFIKCYTNAKDLEASFRFMINTANSLRSWEEIYTRQMSEIISNVYKIAIQGTSLPVRRAIQYIKEHYNEHINLEDVAQRAYLSPSYFSTVFKRETGQNFISFVSKYRIDVAKELIRQGNLNISEISDKLGFQDTRYFAKLFKRITGITPSAFKHLYKDDFDQISSTND